MYRAYVGLIDLTNELSSDQEEEHSDIEELPPTEISLSSVYDRYVRSCI